MRQAVEVVGHGLKHVPFKARVGRMAGVRLWPCNSIQAPVKRFKSSSFSSTFYRDYLYITFDKKAPAK